MCQSSTTKKPQRYLKYLKNPYGNWKTCRVSLSIFIIKPFNLILDSSLGTHDVAVTQEGWVHPLTGWLQVWTTALSVSRLPHTSSKVPKSVLIDAQAWQKLSICLQRGISLPFSSPRLAQTILTELCALCHWSDVCCFMHFCIKYGCKVNNLLQLVHYPVFVWLYDEVNDCSVTTFRVLGLEVLQLPY